MEQLSGTVKQNADNCKLASGLAQNAEKVAHEGANAVHGVVEGMGRIDQSSKRMADIIGVIAGIGEINKAILQLETVTQQNAALVEEASAASLTFQEQADRMRDLVARFKIPDEAPVVPARAASKPASAAARPKAAPLPHPGPQPLPKKKMARQAVGAD